LYCSRSSSGPTCGGLFGTFIGVPIALAFLSFCGQHPSSRWVADLLGGPKQTKADQL